MVGRVKHLGLVLALLIGALLGACGGAPERAPSSPAPPGSSASAPSGSSGVPSAVRAVPDDCEQQSGQPPPEPLARTYTGVAAKARCQREVYTIMGGVTHFLGVKCQYCHLVPDYKAMTHRKEIANWMASDLIPSLQRKKNGAAPWCNNCHMAEGKGVAKILGDPRRPSFAVEWMTTHMVEDFQSKAGSALHCKSCHVGNVGTPQFERHVILTNHLPVE
jgi:hypothetical protein